MVKINPDDGKYTQQALFALILRFTYLIILRQNIFHISQEHVHTYLEGNISCNLKHPSTKVINLLIK